MKKNKWMFISIASLLLIVSTILIVTKPNESDFVIWMEDNYNVHCYDPNCDAFEMTIKKDGEEKVIVMQSAQSSYSPGLFIMSKEIVYRNLEDSSLVLELKVKGLVGKILIVDEKKRLPYE